MARYQKPGRDLIYSAAERWRDEAVRRDGSLFTPGKAIWTPANLRDIEPRLAISPSPTDKFQQKLATQLSGAPAEQVQLYAEATYLYFLPTLGILGKAKRSSLKLIQAFAPDSSGVPAELESALDQWLYDPGSVYNIHRPDMVKYVLSTAGRLKELSAAAREATLADPWQLRDFLHAVDTKWTQPMRGSLLHLLHPDTFERIVSPNHKTRILTAFGQFVRSPGANVDRKILEIRHALEAEYGVGFDFYGDARVLQRWYPEKIKEWSDDPGSAEPPRIAEEAGDPAEVGPEMDRVFRRLDAALALRGQAILYGPPGTGKTYTALRFAVWWLAKRLKRPDADAMLTDDAVRRSLDREFTQAQRNVWMVIANPKEWSWDRLPAGGTVDFRFGRLARNFALVQPGDLIFGYQSTPDKRIVVLAEVVKALHAEPGSADEGRVITLKALRQVANGPTYEDLKDEPRLAASEPLRMRMQGTLFAMTDEEAAVLLAFLSERGVKVDDLGVGDRSVGPLTRVTFHPSYSYEDFVEGFRPVPSGTDQLALRLTDGVFKRVCVEAAAHPERPYLVLIDEVNRGNLPRIFGELITLLEKDKRGLPVVLPQSHQVFSVPENVYLLGTMNTADRSIRLLDAAIRRRFAFEELMPQPLLLRGQLVDDLDLEVFLDELNNRIAQNVGREKQIGHSFLLGKGVSDPAEFERRFTQEILPLLQEYAYEDFDTLAKLVGTEIVDAARKTFRYELLDDPERLVAALAREFPAQG